jgi:hypothetical protein
VSDISGIIRFCAYSKDFSVDISFKTGDKPPIHGGKFSCSGDKLYSPEIPEAFLSIFFENYCEYLMLLIMQEIY